MHKIAIFLNNSCFNFCFTNNCKVATDGLISYWSFDNKQLERETAKDIMENNNGIIQGQHGEDLEFHGTPIGLK